ncbi:hypothetical protein BBD31_01775 [Elizabethkingia anophelis]|nr:hypothetical protein [Elizabethkingia anophelis]AQW96704.1 hypothetical protein BBD31_01775 [Elizabethkingia anophelis]SPW16882.1 Uncharacterised protein [Elizabethkingia anophelis]
MTNQKLSHQEKLDLRKNKRIRTACTITGTILLFICGLLPFLDNIIASILPNLTNSKVEDYVSFNAAVWALSMSIAPVIIIAATFLRPYFLAYAFPVFSFTASFLAYFKAYVGLGFDLMSTLYFMAFGVTLIFMLIFWMFKRYIKSINLADKIQEKTIDLLYEEVYKK